MPSASKHGERLSLQRGRPDCKRLNNGRCGGSGRTVVSPPQVGTLEAKLAQIQGGVVAWLRGCMDRAPLLYSTPLEAASGPGVATTGHQTARQEDPRSNEQGSQPPPAREQAGTPKVSIPSPESALRQRGLQTPRAAQSVLPSVHPSIPIGPLFLLLHTPSATRTADATSKVCNGSGKCGTQAPSCLVSPVASFARTLPSPGQSRANAAILCCHGFPRLPHGPVLPLVNPLLCCRSKATQIFAFSVPSATATAMAADMPNVRCCTNMHAIHSKALPGYQANLP